MNRHAIISFVVTLVFLVGAGTAFVRGDALFALAGVVFLAWGIQVVRASDKDPHD